MADFGFTVVLAWTQDHATLDLKEAEQRIKQALRPIAEITNVEIEDVEPMSGDAEILE